MSTLTGTKIKDTYPSLLKFSNNGSLDPYFLNIISDGLGNNTPLLISGAEFGTQIPATSVPYGFSAQLFFNGNVILGDYAGQFNKVFLSLNDFNKNLCTYNNNLAQGLNIEFTNKTYSFGDFNSVDNGTSIVVDDTAESVTITAEQDLSFVGAGMENTSAGGTSGKYLRILLNNNEYKIELLDP